MARRVRNRLWLSLGMGVCAAVAATSAFGGAAAKRPTLTVGVKGPGTVVSKPKGISCPRVCKATFAPHASVLLTPRTKNGSRFRRWGGACTGTGARASCRVRLASSTHVTAEFVRGPALPVEPGAYSGPSPQNGAYPITFYVAPGARRMTNISIPFVAVSCVPPGNYSSRDYLGILKAVIKPDGSFGARGTQVGVFSGVKARFTYSFKGRLQRATAAGTFREDIVFTDSARHRCTSNIQSWKAARTTDPRPPAHQVTVPGSYAGPSPQNGAHPISFYVAPGGGQMTNISIPFVAIACAPQGNYPSRDRLGILKATIRPDGSFDAKGVQNGVLVGFKARFTYAFSGYFQGVTADGAATASGVFRETITFTDSSARTCTSNDQFWQVKRTTDPQPPRKTLVQPGKYSGPSPQNSAYPVTFTVGAGGRSMTDITIPLIALSCAPPGNYPSTDKFLISTATVNRDGSFNANGSQVGVFAGAKARFTYSFTGYFQGMNSRGEATASGIFREDIVFTDSAPHVCTSNEQSWTANRTG